MLKHPAGRALRLDRLGVYMEAKNIIRDAVAHVTLLRQSAAGDPQLAQAISDIKHFQARRFAGTYFDLLHSERYQRAAQFFLEELYSEKDYSLRDEQFARIAGALQRLFPHQVVETAVALAELHVLTEQLDHDMALQWMRLAEPYIQPAKRYLLAWKAVGRESERTHQLTLVLQIGVELDHLTRTRGLRTTLKMMRRPARATGLGALQEFLEAGFDTFANMSGNGARAMEFLNTIRDREESLMAQLFAPDFDTGLQALTSHLLR